MRHHMKNMTKPSSQMEDQQQPGQYLSLSGGIVEKKRGGACVDQNNFYKVLELYISHWVEHNQCGGGTVHIVGVACGDRLGSSLRLGTVDLH